MAPPQMQPCGYCWEAADADDRFTRPTGLPHQGTERTCWSGLLITAGLTAFYTGQLTTRSPGRMESPMTSFRAYLLQRTRACIS